MSYEELAYLEMHWLYFIFMFFHFFYIIFLPVKELKVTCNIIKTNKICFKNATTISNF